MNYKHVLIALVICMCMAMPVMAYSDNNDPSKYKDTNPAYSVPDRTTYGYVVINLRAGGSAQDTNIWVSNDLNTNIAPFDKTYNPSTYDTEGKNPDYSIIKIQPYGSSGLVQMAAGNFTAYLQNGNGNQLEIQKFYVGGADVTYVNFLGAAISTSDEPEVVPDVEEIVCKDVSIEVTNIVKGLVTKHGNDDEYLFIPSDYANQNYNKLFTDPNYGFVKELRVVYKFKEVNNGGPDRDNYQISNDRDRPKKHWALEIKSAKYGTFCKSSPNTHGYRKISVLETEDLNINMDK
jgi:hypothetical protein